MKMNIEHEVKSYWLPELRRSVDIKRGQVIDDNGTVGVQLKRYYPEDVINNDGTSKLGELLTISSSASEIDGSVNNKHNFLIGNNLYDLSNDKILLEASDFVGTSSNGGFIFENSTENTKFSTKTLKIGNSTNGASTTADRTKTLVNPIDLSGLEFVTFWIFAPEEHLVSNQSASYLFCNLKFFIYSGTNYYGGHIVTSAMASLQSGWNNISIPISKFSLNSATPPDLSNVTKFRMQFETRDSNIGVPVYIDSIIFSTKKLDKVPVCVTIDDGLSDSYEMTKIMNFYGVPVSTFVTPSKVDGTEPNFLRLDKLKELYDNGNHVGIHGHELSIFATDFQQIIDSSNWLKNNGFTRDNGHLYGTYPNGGYSQGTIDFLRLNGFKGFRQVIGEIRNDSLNTQATKGILKFESLQNGGIADKFRISGYRSPNYLGFSQDVDNAIIFNAAFLPYHHSFSEVGTKADWINMAKYLKQKVDEGLIECLTFPQFCKKYS